MLGTVDLSIWMISVARGDPHGGERWREEVHMRISTSW